MDEVFKEDIAPVVDRTASGIDALKSRNLMTVLQEPFNEKWNIGPGSVPQNQSLEPSSGTLQYDLEPRSKVERHLTQVTQEEVQLDDQSE